MCLILLAWRSHPAYPFVIAANRDEFYARPTARAGFWPDAPHVLAGRDLQAGGTWLGITRTGRFAALTNYRDPASMMVHAPSRGELVSRFLFEDESPESFTAGLVVAALQYNGFNLICRDGDSLCYFSNCGDQPRRLGPGIYGLSNHLLDTPWPKVARGKSALAEALRSLPDTEGMFALLRDDAIAPDHELPRTGVSLEWERLLSAAFIRSETYGTRSSTVIVAGADGSICFEERGYSPRAGFVPGERFEWRLSPP